MLPMLRTLLCSTVLTLAFFNLCRMFIRVGFPLNFRKYGKESMGFLVLIGNALLNLN